MPAPPSPRLLVLVLAAGQGTRLRSKKIKLLHEVAGRPMAAHVLEAARALKPGRLITVVGFQAPEVQAALQDKQVRVTGKNRDDLQSAIALVRKGGFELPLQYTNFRD